MNATRFPLRPALAALAFAAATFGLVAAAPAALAGKSLVARAAPLAQATAPLAQPPALTEITGAARTQVLREASAALEALRSVQGRFLQIGPDGSETGGAFALQRPGRVRFAYDAPTPLTIVSDGATVAIHDSALRNTDRVPLRSTPLYFVLKGDMDLEADFRITRVARRGDTLFVTARDRTGDIDGELTLALVGPQMELRYWEALDATGARTTVALRNVQPVERLSPRLFRLEETEDPTSRRGGR